MKTVMKIALGVVIALVLVIGGCVAIIGGAVDEGIKEVEKEQARYSITKEEFASIEPGMSRTKVEQQLGKPDPKATQTYESKGYSDTCIYYNEAGGGVLDMFQFCFNSKGRLDSKGRY